MVKVTCQHSKLEFEASTARTKQHPQVAAMKTRANRDGNYREVMDALEVVEKAGGYTTIDEYVKLVSDHIAGKKQAAQDLAAKAVEREKRAAAQDALFEIWRIVSGYAVRTETYQEAYDNPNPRDAMDEVLYRTRSRTIWTAPDGQEINSYTVRQIFDGKFTMAEYRAKMKAEADAKAAKEAEDAAREKAHDESIVAFDIKREEIRKAAKLVNRFEMPSDAQVIAKIERGNSSHRTHDEIRKAVINGVNCYRIVSGSGYDDDGFYNYYADDPAKAGLTPTETEYGSRWI